jgi:DNA-binding CsgD family transcriptional regulator
VQRVAELVAGGLSNKEVAARLFVTVYTVEAHLKDAHKSRDPLAHPARPAARRRGVAVRPIVPSGVCFQVSGISRSRGRTYRGRVSEFLVETYAPRKTASVLVARVQKLARAA